MKSFNNLFNNTFNKKHWINESEFCNTKTHPIFFHYRKYSRGKNRCNVCGAKLGRIKCIRQAYRERMVDSIFESNPLLDLLKKRGKLKEVI